MKRMTGIILMIFGTLTFVVGIVLYGSPKEPLSIESDKNKVSELEKAIEMAIADGVLTSNEKDLIKKIAVENGHDYNLVITDVEKRLTGLTSDSETQIIDPNEKNGYDFEKFIVQKFNKKYYRVKEWAGDKYVKGVYAETTTQPDILMKLQLSSSEAEFSIECKWRQRLYKGGVQLATESQLSRYKDFEKDRGIPVFVAIGIGGKGSCPKTLFIVPLGEISNGFVPLNKLKEYEVGLDREFFYNMKTKVLS